MYRTGADEPTTRGGKIKGRRQGAGQGTGFVS